jgi:ankyrin repeat protein
MASDVIVVHACLSSLQNGDTPLQLACGNGSHAVASSLIKLGSAINAGNKVRADPFHYYHSAWHRVSMEVGTKVLLK